MPSLVGGSAGGSAKHIQRSRRGGGCAVTGTSLSARLAPGRSLGPCSQCPQGWAGEVGAEKVVPAEGSLCWGEAVDELLCGVNPLYITINYSEDVEKTDPSCTVVGNV